MEFCAPRATAASPSTASAVLYTRRPRRPSFRQTIKLLEGKVVTTKGQKRGTRYFAAGSAPKAAAATMPAKAVGAQSHAKGPNAAMAERVAKVRAARKAKRAAR